MLPSASHNWHGNAEQLAREAFRLMQQHPVFSDQPAPNERLVRDYVRRGIVSTPDHVGREARYRYGHLIELIAARALIADGWPLRMIAQTFKGASEDDLLEIVEGRRPANPELGPHDQDQLPEDGDLRTAGFATGFESDLPLAPAFTSRKEPVPFVERATEISKVRADARAARRRLNLSEAAASTRVMVVFDIAPWAILGVESDKLERLTDEECKDLSRAVRGALTDRPDRRSG
jgi:hypothetical protein